MRIGIWLTLIFLIAGCRQPSRDARLQAPDELFSEAASRDLKNLFVNPRAHALARARNLSLAEESLQGGEALLSPSVWRKIDRFQRFDSVLLAGPAAEFLPLLSHLAGSPDFRLVRVDNWGVLFVRAIAMPYHPPGVHELKEKIARDADRGIYLAQMALMLAASEQPAAASEYIQTAIEDAPDEPQVRVCAGALALDRRRYSEALRHADRALKIQPGDLSALEIQARAFAAVGAPDRAWQVATELKSRAPEDMNLLFLHAHLASAAHAYSAEQDSLERLIRLAEKRNLSPTDYRVYLGQCFAKQGLARPALQQIELALKDPNLSHQQRNDLSTAAEAVRTRAGSLSQ